MYVHAIDEDCISKLEDDDVDMKTRHFINCLLTITNNISDDGLPAGTCCLACRLCLRLSCPRINNPSHMSLSRRWLLPLAPALDILVSVAAESRSEDPNVTIAGDCVTCHLCDTDIVPRDTTSLHSSQSQLAAELEKIQSCCLRRLGAQSCGIMFAYQRRSRLIG